MEQLFCDGCSVPIDAGLIAPTMMREPDGRATYHDGGMAVNQCADGTWFPLDQTAAPDRG